MKAVLTRKPIALNVYIRKEEPTTTNNLSFHLRKLERKSNASLKQTKEKKY